MEHFSLVDSQGSTVTENEIGLLLFRGRTLCDTGFIMNREAADAICEYLLPSSTYVYWTSGRSLDMQNSFEINSYNLQCHTTQLERCSYNFISVQQCQHDQDIFLKCHSGNEILGCMNKGIIMTFLPISSESLSEITIHRI